MSAEVVGGFPLETNGINVIPDAERKGRPSQLFWPWFAANIAVLGLSYGSWLLGFGVSFWQATIAGVIGSVFSFFLVGLVALSGKLASAPTMVVSRAAFGVNGNKLPTVISWLLLVGWETVLVFLGAKATATVLGEYGVHNADVAKILGLAVMVVLVAGGGILGFTVVMRMQTFITLATLVLTIGYVLFTIKDVHWDKVSAIPGGPMQAVIGALVFAMTGFGLGWVNSGADYSRYLPRSASSRGVVGWTTFGASVAPVVLVIWGLLLAGSDKKLADAISADPIGALTTLLPHATLWLFLIVVLLGLAGGAVLDIYSSGLALLSVGLKIPRWSAAGIDAIIMSLGAIYLLWIAKQDFFYTFQGFLITLGVPIAAWCGIFLGDMALRKAAMAEDELYQPSGRYRSLNPVALILIVVCTALGWGLVISSTTGLTWQGYLLDPLGLRANWAYANLGVLLALALGFFGQYLLGRSRVRAQESIPIPAVQSLV